MAVLQGGYGELEEHSWSELSTTEVGKKGQGLVAAKLSRRGYLAELVSHNSHGIRIHIRASSSDATRSVDIQVRTARSVTPHWAMGKKDLAENIRYVFVCVAPEDSATFYVVPGRDVVEYLSENHAEWLKTRGKHGQAHNATSRRFFEDPTHKYKDRWELLGLD